MNHRHAMDHMLDYMDGRLDPHTEEAMAEHARSCSGCRGWMETHQVLADSLGDAAVDEAPEAHPPSELLALCAVRPEEIGEPSREDLREHLESCRSCRETVALLTDAVREAKPAGSFGRPASAPRQPSRRQWWQGMAVGFVLLVIAIGLKILLGAPVQQSPAGDPASMEVLPGAATAAGVEGRAIELTGRALEGRHVIRGERSLAVSNVAVSPGADVTFQADDLVSFGDGFQVASGASIRVGIGPDGARRPGSGRSGTVDEDEMKERR